MNSASVTDVDHQEGTRGPGTTPTPARWSVVLAVTLLALATRVSRYPSWRLLALGGGDYDPAVMYAASASFVKGHLPYRDFVFLHPPGVLVGLAPFAWLGDTLGDANGLALARAAAILLGTLNTFLVCLLLRRLGSLPVLAGGGLYASWSVVVYTEQLPLLESFLATALLVALLLVRRPRSRAHFLAGAVLGVAVMVKVWAVLDLLLVGAFLLVRFRSRALGWFSAGAAVGGCLLGLPFLLAAPARMWQMIVVAQAGRPDDGVRLLTRAVMSGPAPFLDGRLYRAGTVAGLVLLISLCAVVIVMRLRSAPRRQWMSDEQVWWAVIALAHVALLVLAPAFYAHYAVFAAAPLALVLGSGVANLTARDGRHARWLAPAVLAVVVLLALGSTWGSWTRAQNAARIPAGERAALTRWAHSHDCVKVSIADRVLIDEVSDALDGGCSFEVDPYGVELFEASQGRPRPRVWGESAWQDLMRADGVILPADVSRWSFTDSQRAAFLAEFVHEGDVGGRGLWGRSPRG